jgi:hypothetical protein
MTFFRQFWRSLGAFAFGVLISSSAFAQSVTTRLVVAGGAATSTKIVPGAATSIDVRLDIVTAQIIGTAFKISQTSPASSGFFSITGRSFVGSPFTDTASGTPDATVLAAASALLNPDNDDNLGRATVWTNTPPTSSPGIPPAANVLAANLTLTSSAATPLGTYTIRPTAGVSFASDTVFNDYSMSTGTPFSIIVGQTLTVTKSGTGTGTVTANSGTINCGVTCSDIYPGTSVTLTATPSAGSTFAGWSGAGCSGTSTCVVTVNAATSVQAQFNAAGATFGLTVTKSGAGTGTVTSTPAGINCGVTCTANYASGTLVTLTPTPAAGSAFANWTGACSGSGACVVTMDAAKTVFAAFDVSLRPTLASVWSRRVHGTAGTFNLRTDGVPTNPVTEPRQGLAHTFVFTFNKPVTGGAATVTQGTATAGVPTFSGNEMRVPLTNVSDRQYVTVTVSNVTSSDGGTGGSGSVRVGFLYGDVNQNRQVTSGDAFATNAVLGQVVSTANYLKDVNVNGFLTSGDNFAVNNQAGHVLPLP